MAEDNTHCISCTHLFQSAIQTDGFRVLCRAVVYTLEVYALRSIMYFVVPSKYKLCALYNLSTTLPSKPDARRGKYITCNIAFSLRVGTRKINCFYEFEVYIFRRRKKHRIVFVLLEMHLKAFHRRVCRSQRTLRYLLFTGYVGFLFRHAHDCYRKYTRTHTLGALFSGEICSRLRSVSYVWINRRCASGTSYSRLCIHM